MGDRPLGLNAWITCKPPLMIGTTRIKTSATVHSVTWWVTVCRGSRHVDYHLASSIWTVRVTEEVAPLFAKSPFLRLPEGFARIDFTFFSVQSYMFASAAR